MKVPWPQESKHTGWATSILNTLTGSYEKNTVCRKEIVIGIHSIYRDISLKTINLEIKKFLYRKKSNWKLGAIYVIFSPKFNLKFWGCLRLIWSQACYIMSTSIKYYNTIAFLTFCPRHHELGFTSVASISQKIFVCLYVWHQFCY